MDTSSHYAQHVFDTAGIANVADAPVTDGVASAEQIIEWDPEIIFLSAFDPAVPTTFITTATVGSHRGKDKRVYRAPRGHRWQVPSAESPCTGTGSLP